MVAPVNVTSGVAAANGTASHTISFGFTPAAGNLLTFIAAGAVTHTDASGTWVEQLQPVNGCELSVFTKTAAGDTSITLNHNGSNYRVAWAAYEFAAGSTYVAGIGSNSVTAGTSGGSRAWANTLSGLPGTSVTVVAAACSANFTGGSVTLTATWTAPFSSVANQTGPSNAGVDGVGLVVGSAAGYTSTTAQPTFTPTWSAGLTGWATDMQEALFAIGDPVTGIAPRPVVVAQAVRRGSIY